MHGRSLESEILGVRHIVHKAKVAVEVGVRRLRSCDSWLRAWPLIAIAVSCFCPLMGFAQPLAWQSYRPIDALVSPAVTFDSVRGTVLRFGGTLQGSIGSGIPSKDTWDWDRRAWQLRTREGPGFVRNSVMCFDSHRGVAVLFCGPNQSGTAFETWEWDGSVWSRRAITGPSPRTLSAMAYDRARGVAVLFGGLSTSSSQLLGDTWEWDGSTWTQRAVTGPSPRSYHALAYDSVRNVCVLFGGSTNQSAKNGETWEWNGTAWALRSTSGPSPRFAAAMCFDSIRQRCQLFGGRLEVTYSDELWEWDGTNWTQRPSNGAPGLAGHALMFDEIRGELVVTGGDGRVIGPFWFDGATWKTKAAETYVSPSFSKVAEDLARKELVAIGPQYTPNGMETWLWSGSSWYRSLAPAPPGRVDYAVAYDSRRSVLVLFGGEVGAENLLSDTWEWNGVSWTQQPIAGPPGRSRHAMAFDEHRGVMVLFGGTDGKRDLGDVWEYDGHMWSQRNPGSGPWPRSKHAMTYDPTRQVTVMVGGESQSAFNDIGIAVPLGPDWWEWDGQRWQHRTSINAPSPRTNSFFVTDRVGHRLFLFGGVSEDGPNSELWELRDAVWTQVATTGTQASPFLAGAAMDHFRQRFVVIPQFLGSNIAPRYLQLPACPADLTYDGLVNDDDFGTFVAGYALALCVDPKMSPFCPGDLDLDRLIDDRDFLIFVDAYNDVVCP